AVPAGSSLLVQVFAHMPEQAEEADAMAREFDAGARRRGVAALATEIARGSKLTFELQLPKLQVDEPVQELVWGGRPASVQFGVTVPARMRPQQVIGKLLVAQDAVPI